MKNITLALALLLPLSLAGCKTFKAAPTPGVPQFYSQAALIENDFSGVLLQAQTMFTTAHTTGLVTDANYRTGMQTFLAIAQQGDNIESLTKSEAGQATVTAAIQALIQQVGTMPTAFGIKDANTQAAFTALCTSMQTILQSAITVINSTTPVAAPAA